MSYLSPITLDEIHRHYLSSNPVFSQKDIDLSVSEFLKRWLTNQYQAKRAIDGSKTTWTYTTTGLRQIRVLIKGVRHLNSHYAANIEPVFNEWLKTPVTYITHSKTFGFKRVKTEVETPWDRHECQRRSSDYIVQWLFGKFLNYRLAEVARTTWLAAGSPEPGGWDIFNSTENFSRRHFHGAGFDMDLSLWGDVNTLEKVLTPLDNDLLVTLEYRIDSAIANGDGAMFDAVDQDLIGSLVALANIYINNSFFKFVKETLIDPMSDRPVVHYTY